ncbi:hypothetical protein G6F35_016637 [Rhizopus arrhizus]|nr:hypothetical protein G6F35_016637 [Rhizopus arrhizus]
MFSALRSALAGRQSQQRRANPWPQPGMLTPQPSHTSPSIIMSAYSPMARSLLPGLAPSRATLDYLPAADRAFVDAGGAENLDLPASGGEARHVAGQLLPVLLLLAIGGATEDGLHVDAGHAASARSVAIWRSAARRPATSYFQ